MKKVKILLAAMVLLSFVGCSKSEENINLSNNIAKEEQAPITEKIEVISQETINFETPLSLYGTRLFFDENNLMYKYTDIYNEPKEIYYNKLNVEGDVAKPTFMGSKVFVQKEQHPIMMNIEVTEENRTLVSDYYNNPQYEIDPAIISGENTIYHLFNDILVYYVEGESKISWSNITTKEGGYTEIPSDITPILALAKLEDEHLFLTLKSDNDVSYEDTLVVIDLFNNKFIEKMNLGGFYYLEPINKETIFLVSKEDFKVNFEIYNIETKERKAFYSYEIENYEPGDAYTVTNYIGVFPSKNKLYYCESDGFKIYVKVAPLNGMNVGEAVTVYEKEYDRTKGYTIPLLSINKDENELVIYGEHTESRTLNNFIRVKLL